MCECETDPHYRERIELEARIARLQELYDVASLVGDPYKLFGVLKDYLRADKSQLAALDAPKGEVKNERA